MKMKQIESKLVDEREREGEKEDTCFGWFSQNYASLQDFVGLLENVVMK